MSLAGKQIANTYQGILVLNSDNQGLSLSVQTVKDGLGTTSPLALSTDKVLIHGNSYPTTTGAAGQVIVSNGAGELSWSSVLTETDADSRYIQLSTSNITVDSISVSSVNINPTGLGYGINYSRNVSGTSPVGVNLNLVNHPSDTLEVAGFNFLNYNTWQSVFGGPNTHGGRQGTFSLLVQNAPTNVNNINRNYVSSSFFIETNSGDGGTLAEKKGAYFAINPYALASSGAKNIYNLTAGEVNWAVEDNADVDYLFGLQLVTHARHKTPGKVADAMLGFSAQTGAAPMGAGISFNSINGVYPIAPNSPLIVSDAATVSYGLDFRDLVVTESYLAGSNLRVKDHSITIGSVAAQGTIEVNDGDNTINADLTLKPAGSGLIRFGEFIAGTVTPNGYISIKTENGDVVYLPVFKP